MTDRDAHRAAVEAGYASLAEYIEKWGDNKVSIFDIGLTRENLKKLCDAIEEQADEIERLREALKRIADYEGGPVDLIWEGMAEIARSALQQKDSE